MSWNGIKGRLGWDIRIWGRPSWRAWRVRSIRYRCEIKKWTYRIQRSPSPSGVLDTQVKDPLITGQFQPDKKEIHVLHGVVFLEGMRSRANGMFSYDQEFDQQYKFLHPGNGASYPRLVDACNSIPLTWFVPPSTAMPHPRQFIGVTLFTHANLHLFHSRCCSSHYLRVMEWNVESLAIYAIPYWNKRKPGI